MVLLLRSARSAAVIRNDGSAAVPLHYDKATLPQGDGTVKRLQFLAHRYHTHRRSRHRAAARCHDGLRKARSATDKRHDGAMISFASVHTTRSERRRPLPGDTLIPNSAATVMHAITIDATPESVWPWLVQMGSGRAGWYSYDWVDNDGRPSASEIVPSLQHVVPGDIMPALPGEKRSFIVAAVEPAHNLILVVPAASGGLVVTWDFFLEPLALGRTRLLVRGRVNAQWPAGAMATASARRRPIERVYALLANMPRWLMAPIAKFGHGIMQARQLRGIKRRAEAMKA